jgi:hypothetical protein
MVWGYQAALRGLGTGVETSNDRDNRRIAGCVGASSIRVTDGRSVLQIRIERLDTAAGIDQQWRRHMPFDMIVER